MWKYWLKIALGAVAVFGVGFIGITAFRTAKGVVRDGNIPVPFDIIPFTIDGNRLGSVRNVHIVRHNRRLQSVDLRLELSDSAALATLEACHLTVDDPEHIDADGFHCAADGSEVEGLTQFGTVTFSLDGSSVEGTIPILLPKDVVMGIREGRSQELKAYQSARETRAALAEAEALRAEAKALAESLGKAPRPPDPPSP